MLASASVKAAAAFRFRSLPISQSLYGHSYSVAAMSTCTQQEQQYLAAFAERFQEAPETAAKSLVDSLSTQHRSILLEALGSEAKSVPKAYLDKLFQEADTSAPLQQLDKYACFNVVKQAGICFSQPWVLSHLPAFAEKSLPRR